MSPQALRRRSIALVGTRPGLDHSDLSPADWQALDRLAAQHRLQPLLHHQHRDNALVPGAIRSGWSNAYRVQAMVALGQQAELVRTTDLLRAAGFAPLALKGAWLARYAYPHPALRPLRDIDLLLDPDTVSAGFELLLGAGYRLAEPAELPLADLLRTEKHLPPLLAPGGTVIELHHRLWEPAGRLDHASPVAIDAAVRAAAVTEADGIAYPAPADMLAHLIAHAVYSHRLDCGPLLLADIDYLLSARPIDWGAFWLRAGVEGWLSGARLVLDLVATYRPGTLIEIYPQAGPEVPAAVRDTAIDLLLQDLGSRHSAGVLASVRRQGWQGLVDRTLGRRRAEGRQAVQREMGSAGGFGIWALTRLQRTGGDLVKAEPRRQGLALARLSRWLDQPRG